MGLSHYGTKRWKVEGPRLSSLLILCTGHVPNQAMPLNVIKLAQNDLYFHHIVSMTPAPSSSGCMNQIPSELLMESTAHILKIGKVDIRQLWTSKRVTDVTYPLLIAVALPVLS